MIVGYGISGPDNDSYLNPDGWGKSICEVIDFVNYREKFLSEKFRVKRSNFNWSNTYDGGTIVSQKFRDFCLRNNYEGLEFYPLKKQKELYLFKCSIITKFDIDRRQTKFEEYKEECKMYNSIAGAHPICLKSNKVLSDGFYSTDIKFGGGYEQSPILIIGVDTYNKLKIEQFKDIDFEPILDEYEWEIKADDNYFCRCCGFNSLHEKPNGEYNICRICYWEDDPIQFKEPNYQGGANKVSLIQAQQNFEEFGACEREMIKYCTKPHKSMKRKPNWKRENAI